MGGCGSTLIERRARGWDFSALPLPIVLHILEFANEGGFNNLLKWRLVHPAWKGAIDFQFRALWTDLWRRNYDVNYVSDVFTKRQSVRHYFIWNEYRVEFRLRANSILFMIQLEEPFLWRHRNTPLTHYVYLLHPSKRRNPERDLRHGYMSMHNNSILKLNVPHERKVYWFAWFFKHVLHDPE